MHFNAADLSAAQILLVVDVVDRIVLNDGKYAAEMPYDSSLPAVVDVAPSDNMRAYCFLAPSLPLCLTDTVALCLRTVLVLPFRPFVIVFWLQIFP